MQHAWGSLHINISSPLIWMDNARHKWEDNIKINIKEIECDVVDWIHLSMDKAQLWYFPNTMDSRDP